MKLIATNWILSAGVFFTPALVFASPRPAAKAAAKPKAAKTTAKPAVPPGMMVAPFVLPLRDTPRAVLRGPVFLPKGAKNVALNRPVTSNSRPVFGGQLPQVVDGVKAGFYGNGVYLSAPNHNGAPKVNPWVQINLQSPFIVHGVLIWHNFFEPKAYEDVIIQLSDDPDFKTNVRTVYNNDADNSIGFGRGTDKEYLEDFQGHWIPIKAQKATYIRVYGKGKGEYYGACQYAEIEVWATVASGMMEATFVLPPPSYLG